MPANILRRNALTLSLLVSITLTVIAGLLTKSYTGWGSRWVNDYAGDILFEVCWCLFLFAFFPRKDRIEPICLGVFLVTSGLEFLQLWHPPILEAWRSHILGKLLLGKTFTWWDFPYYFLGCLLSWWYLHWLVKVNNRDSRSRLQN
jgi:hypothetical protein